MKKYFIFDCEFAGTDPDMSLLSLFGQVLDENLETIDKIKMFIKPDNGKYIIDPQAMAVNKINLIEHDKRAIPESQATKTFKNFLFKHNTQDCGKLIPTGHNISLDIRFIKHHLLKNINMIDGSEWGTYFSHRIIDTASIAQFLILAGKLPSTLNGSLESLAEYFNLSYENAHEAEFDVNLTLTILKRQLDLLQ